MPTPGLSLDCLRPPSSGQHAAGHSCLTSTLDPTWTCGPEEKEPYFPSPSSVLLQGTLLCAHCPPSVPGSPRLPFWCSSRQRRLNGDFQAGRTLTPFRKGCIRRVLVSFPRAQGWKLPQAESGNRKHRSWSRSPGGIGKMRTVDPWGHTVALRVEPMPGLWRKGKGMPDLHACVGLPRGGPCVAEEWRSSGLSPHASFPIHHPEVGSTWSGRT